MRDIKEQGVKRHYFLGDVVGYGAHPQKCIQALRELECVSLLGNHDEAVCQDDIDTDFNPLAREGVHFSRSALEEEDREWIRTLPYKARTRGATFVHSSLYLPEEWLYVVGPEDAWVHFKRQRGRLCFIGHTHVPCVWELNDGLSQYEPGEGEFELDQDSKYLVNVGSVGQPRDRQIDATYVIWDNRKKSIRYRRVPYAVDQACQSIIDAGLPSMLGHRLFQGR
ncbi:MAG: metallophosphoesterase [Verrucomicrobiota bacterium]